MQPITETDLLEAVDGALSAVLDACQAADRKVDRETSADLSRLYKRIDVDRLRLDSTRWRAARK